MDSQNDTIILKLDDHFGPLTRKQIESGLQNEYECMIKVESLGTGLEQHLDFIDSVGLVSAVIGIASFILQIREHLEKSEWTVDKINKKILEAAVRVTGPGILSNFRYTGINEFLNGDSKYCLVTIEIDDEDYRFYIERDGNIIVIKLHNHDSSQIR